jgi:hypothetical protein
MTTLMLRQANRRRVLASLAAGAAIIPFALGPALAQPAPAVTLFNVVGPRDTIVVGLTAAETAALGSGNPVEALARKIAAEGQMTVWQYGVRRGDGGALVMAPTAKVALMAAGIVRIEPYRAAHPVVAPQG